MINNSQNRPLHAFLFFILLSITFSNQGGAEETEKFKYNDHGKRDPFMSLVSPSGTILNYDNDIEMSDLSLQGVMAGADGQNIAIVNGKVLKINDKIGDFVVNEINPDNILLRKGEQELILKLKKGGLE
jgi:hypothetical protein